MRLGHLTVVTKVECMSQIYIFHLTYHMSPIIHTHTHIYNEYMKLWQSVYLRKNKNTEERKTKKAGVQTFKAEASGITVAKVLRFPKSHL